MKHKTKLYKAMEIPFALYSFLFCFIFLLKQYNEFEFCLHAVCNHVMELYYYIFHYIRCIVLLYLLFRSRYDLRYFSETAPAAAASRIRPHSNAPACFHS